MFEKASQMKLRFTTNRGDVTTEDLWDIPLTSRNNGFSLDDLAKSLNAAVKESGEESFVVKKTRVNSLLELRFEIVKHIINVKLEEAEQEKNAAANKLQKEKILAIITDKEDDGLRDMSLKDLKKAAKKL